MKNKLSSFITTIKNIGVAIFYGLAILGLVDLVVQLISDGEVRLIQTLLNYIFN